MRRALVLCIALVPACAGDASVPDCEEGEVRPCHCADGAAGVEICTDPPLGFDACLCEEGTCLEEDECDDGDPCTEDGCAGGFCTTAPSSGADCDDGVACTEGDTCDAGACAGTAIDCDDENDCTVDACVNGLCGHNPISGCCRVSNDCPLDKLCIDDECVPNPNPCSGAPKKLPDGLVELSWDDGTGVATVADQTWAVTDASLPVASTPRFEAVRFEIDRPARIHGFRVQYGKLPESGKTPLVAGLYPDFGHNGFDFWHPEPLWFGDVCSAFADAGEWLTFVLPEPIEVEDPGLVWVAHFTSGGPDDPSWLFDGSTAKADGSCEQFDSCRSAITLPQVKQWASGGQGAYAFGGLSFPIPNDLLVRLSVEYLEEPDPDATVFEPYDLGGGGEKPGSHMAFGDYDGDGDDDLLTDGPRLLRNDGGFFADATEASGIQALGISGSGGVWGDFDNDGCLDALVFVESTTASETLLRSSCDGTFSDVTAVSGISDVQTYNDCAGSGADRAPTPAAAWWDVDQDGLLDLYLANFNCWTDYSYYVDQVWRNAGDGTFEEWTGTHGLLGYEDPPTPSRGASPIDHDQDGDVDLFVNDYVLVRNLFYRNLGGGDLEEAGEALGLAGGKSVSGGQSYYGHSIGAAWGDLDGDADFDLVVANLAHPRFFDFSDKTEVLLQGEDGTFQDIQGKWDRPEGGAGLRYHETHSVPALADLDQDGNLDLVISEVYDGRPTDFYWGLGDGTFDADTLHAGIPVEGGWGMATADLDLDGDLDLAASGALFRNRLAGGKLAATRPSGHWLQVRAVGNVASNRAALGATVRAVAGGRTWIRHVNGGTGQGDQDSLTVHFGLGDATVVESLEVLFPGGGAVAYPGPFDADRRLWLYEDGTVAPGWASEP